MKYIKKPTHKRKNTKCISVFICGEDRSRYTAFSVREASRFSGISRKYILRSCKSKGDYSFREEKFLYTGDILEI